MTRKEKLEECIRIVKDFARDQNTIWASQLAKACNLNPNILAEALKSLGWTKGYSRVGPAKRTSRVWRAPVEKKTDKECAEEAKRAARLASDYDALKPGDFEYDDADLNEGKRDKAWNQEKKQEFSRAMGTFRDELISGELSENSARFIANVGEQERRFGNKRQARTVSIQAANEALAIRLFKEAAKEYLQGKVEPAGYAARVNPPEPAERALSLFLSDDHLGANLWRAEGNRQFGAVEESRRLEWIMNETADYKLRYRDKTKLNLLLGGDMIEGMLGHDMRAGAPLIEQKVVFWKYFSAFVGYLAMRFPWVDVYAVPGNHGRDIARHPGRATASKWDGHEWGMYYALYMMCSNLKNVKFHLTLKPWAVFDLPGDHHGLLTHADTDLKLGSPLTKGESNYSQLVVANNLGTYGESVDVGCFGHFHTAVAVPGKPYMLYNGPLVPSNNYSRGAGYLKDFCSQWLFESVPGYPVGDLRCLTVGEAQDKDESLNQVIKPFRFALDSETGFEV